MTYIRKAPSYTTFPMSVPFYTHCLEIWRKKTYIFWVPLPHSYPVPQGILSQTLWQFRGKWSKGSRGKKWFLFQRGTLRLSKFRFALGGRQSQAWSPWLLTSNQDHRPPSDRVELSTALGLITGWQALARSGCASLPYSSRAQHRCHFAQKS